MKRSWIKRGTSQLKRSGFKQKPTVPMKRSRLNVVGKSSTAKIKKDIQALLREIVILRDKQCILYGIRCYHQVGMEGIVWQAEHLIERSNSATYADTRLVVLVCKNCHGWKHFKKSNHDLYDEWVRQKLSPERVKHWDKCKQDSWRTTKVDWALEKVALEQTLKHLSPT
jgi:hypothetical protein